MGDPDLSYQPLVLSPSHRVKRGFTRLGIALFVVALLVGAFMSFNQADSGARYLIREHAGVMCLNKAADEGRLMVVGGTHQIDQHKTGCPDAPYLSVSELLNFSKPSPGYLGLFLPEFLKDLGFAGLFALAAFCLPFGSGWILAGFFRD